MFGIIYEIENYMKVTNTMLLEFIICICIIDTQLIGFDHRLMIAGSKRQFYLKSTKIDVHQMQKYHINIYSNKATHMTAVFFSKTR